MRGNYEFDRAPYPPPAESFTQGRSVRAALDQGHRLGIIASPDHRGGLGLAGVWARALTREAIFEALRARRTFGTTGARLDLWMTVNGAPQGSEITAGGAVHVEATVHGSVPGLESDAGLERRGARAAALRGHRWRASNGRTHGPRTARATTTCARARRTVTSAGRAPCG